MGSSHTFRAVSPDPRTPLAGRARTVAAGATVAAVLTGCLTATTTTTAATTGARAAASPVRVTAPAVTTVAEGGTAQVRLVLKTAGRLKRPVTVRWRTAAPVRHTVAAAAAVSGRDYRAGSGSVTFPAGSAPGAVRTVPVRTLRDGAAETAETVRLALAVTGAARPAAEPEVVVNAHGLPYLNRSLPVKQRVADLLGRMTLAEKAGQMTQAGRNTLAAPQDIADRALGSVIYEGEPDDRPAQTPAGWRAVTDGYQKYSRATRLQIPLMLAADAVHGHAFVKGATVMPHNIGLGATRDAALVERLAAITAKEARATGISWNFAPCVCVVRDVRWGRVYESFGESPDLVSELSVAVRGLQGAADGRDLARNDKVLATAKHFVGDGGAAYGSGRPPYVIDQGVTRIDRGELENLHLAPFREAIAHGAGSVMVSFSSLELTGERSGPVKMHAHQEMIGGLLKRDLGFRGIVVSDWEAVDQMDGDAVTDVRNAVNADIDMNTAPLTYKEFGRIVRDEVAKGRIAQSRIDDAVSRILEQKFRLGLFEKPYADTAHLSSVGSAAHRAAAREAVAKSQVLLKNDGNVLPLRTGQQVYVAGSNADNLSHQVGGWTVGWQGTRGRAIPGTTILQGMRRAAPSARITYSEKAAAPTAGHDVGVVVVGETPYAEGRGDVGVGGHDLELSAADKKAVDKVCAAMKCAVLVVSGRPQFVDDRLAGIDALVASWLPGSEGDGVADVLYGRRAFTGRLPLSWPKSTSALPLTADRHPYEPQFPYDWGLTTRATAS
ncbi:glycoside hydrolase family 3 N-terminal domain-containing protein [Streptomyces sp. NPDC048604]|uniref:glycoside hydrolase family 3 N-terminal domain-containing protein n=1 Tax=Streptomyces sp. NPDC048604 TaxID=3365578 RepID=UPI00371E31C0